MRSVVRVWRVASIVLFGLSSASLAAQSNRYADPARAPLTATIISPPSLAPITADTCVLHVWPSPGAQSSYSGWFHGGAVDGDKRGIKGYPAMHADVLSTSVQSQLLASIDWANLRPTPHLKVVVHDAPPPPQDDLARVVPLMGDATECYDELLVHSVLIEGAAFSAKSVRVMMIAKRWRAPERRPATYGAMSVQNLDLGQVTPEGVEATLKAEFLAAVRKYLRDEHFLRR